MFPILKVVIYLLYDLILTANSSVFYDNLELQTKYFPDLL